MCRAVIITALSLEFEAVCAHLDDMGEEDVHPKGDVYTRGTFSADGVTWEVLVAEIGMGNPAAAQETERAIEYFDPQVVLLVGVAGGIKDVSLGDVVAATKVCYYESGKGSDSDEGPVFRPRLAVHHSSFRMVQRVKAENRSKDWLKRLGDANPDSVPRSFVGPIAAGEKVVGSELSDLYEFIRSTYGDALAVAMEDYGFLRAAFANDQVCALVVRGISDKISNKPESDTSGWQPIAARNASAFAFEVLAKLKCIDNSKNKDSIYDAYIDPSPVFERVDLNHFVGREWLMAELDAFLQKNDRGYFVIEAEAGLGKTAFLAWLTQKRGYIHHFSELARGPAGIESGLANLSAQLILAYNPSSSVSN